MQSTTSATPNLDALFLPQLEAFHGIRNEECDVPGSYWDIDPSYGKGYYWNIAFDDMMVVTLCELEFNEDFEFSYLVPDFLCIGKYNKNMSSYFWSSETEVLAERIVGYFWKNGLFKKTVKREHPLRTVSISLLPPAIQWVSARLGIKSSVVVSAASALEGTQIVPGLSECFDTLFTVRPRGVVSRVYYESKIIEAFSLLLDWWLLKQARLDNPIRSADNSALSAVVDYIHENIEMNISLKELCRLSCMSASKLNDLFKKTKYKSPIEYVRDVKLAYGCRLLADESVSIQEVSERLGFSYQGSFSEAFKQRYGICPRTYRRSHSEHYRTANLRETAE